MFNKIASLNISVPVRGPGNTIRQNPVLFDVFSEENNYKAVPVLNEDERRVANLPLELLFVFENGKPVSQRGAREGNFHAIQDIVHELQRQNLL
ncbi:MAG: hypothetical protein ACXVBH_04225 [Flavisolibacter sp.]